MVYFEYMKVQIKLSASYNLVVSLRSWDKFALKMKSRSSEKCGHQSNGKIISLSLLSLSLSLFFFSLSHTHTHMHTHTKVCFLKEGKKQGRREKNKNKIKEEKGKMRESEKRE